MFSEQHGESSWEYGLEPTITCPVNNSSSRLQLQHLHLVGQSYTRPSSCLHCFNMDPDTCVNGPKAPCISVQTDLAMLGHELRGRGIVEDTALNSAGRVLSPHALYSTADPILSRTQLLTRRHLIMALQPYSDALASTDIYRLRTQA